MKKVLFLAFVTLITTACPIVKHPPELPPESGIDWSLDIVKFKNPEYKNYILARQGGCGEGLTTYRDTLLYRMEDPLMYDFMGPGMSLSPIYEKGIWIELADDYYLCYWRWQTLFSPYFLDNYCATPKRRTNYWEYNLNKDAKAEIENTLLLMRDEWNSLPDTIPYVSKLTYYREYGNSGPFVTQTIYNYLYSTTDTSRILKEYPIAEHYVVTAKSLFDFTHMDCDKTTKIFLGYDPRHENGGIIDEFSVDQSWFVKDENGKSGWNKFYTNTYDALSDTIRDLLKSVIKSGKLQEYLEYDLEYNGVKKSEKSGKESDI